MTHLSRAIRSGHPGSLFSAFLYFDVSFMIWVLIGALGTFIARDLGLTATEKGVVAAIPLLGGAFFRILFGLLADRFGPKQVGVVSLIVMLVPLAWGWLAAESFVQVVGMGLLLGVAGASFAVALPLASRWYPPEHQGIAMGIAGAGNSGTVISVLLAPRLAHRIGWHGVFGLAMIPVLVTLLLFVRLAREVPERGGPERLRCLVSLFREPDLWWFNLFYSITFGGFVGLASFLSIFFHDHYGVTAVVAGNLTALCVFAGSFCRPVGGYLADRLGALTLLIWIYACVALILCGVSLLPPLAIVVVLIFVGMAGLGMGNGAIFQMVPQVFRKEIGMVSGLVGAAGGIGGFFLPSVLGWVKDMTGSYGVGFLIYGLLTGLSLFSLGFFRHRWRMSRAVMSLLPEDSSADQEGRGPMQDGRVPMEVVFGG